MVHRIPWIPKKLLFQVNSTILSMLSYWPLVRITLNAKGAINRFKSAALHHARLQDHPSDSAFAMVQSQTKPYWQSMPYSSWWLFQCTAKFFDTGLALLLQVVLIGVLRKMLVVLPQTFFETCWHGLDYEPHGVFCNFELLIHTDFKLCIDTKPMLQLSCSKKYGLRKENHRKKYVCKWKKSKDLLCPLPPFFWHLYSSVSLLACKLTSGSSSWRLLCRARLASSCAAAWLQDYPWQSLFASNWVDSRSCRLFPERVHLCVRDVLRLSKLVEVPCCSDFGLFCGFFWPCSLRRLSLFTSPLVVLDLDVSMSPLYRYRRYHRCAKEGYACLDYSIVGKKNFTCSIMVTDCNCEAFAFDNAWLFAYCIVSDVLRHWIALRLSQRSKACCDDLEHELSCSLMSDMLHTPILAHACSGLQAMPDVPSIVGALGSKWFVVYDCHLQGLAEVETF